MAEVTPAPRAVGLRDQFAAIAQLRWKIFIHSLRTVRGRMELVSWIFIGFGYSVLGIGGTIGLAFLTWFLVWHNREEWLAAPLWLIFLVWQVLPVMATAFTENFDASNFLRFPLSFRSYFMIRMAYGTLDPTTIVGCLWLAGMAIGAGAAVPSLFLWVAIVLAAFAALNILLGRMIFSWLERWLARRKSREILCCSFFSSSSAFNSSIRSCSCTFTAMGAFTGLLLSLSQRNSSPSSDFSLPVWRPPQSRFPYRADSLSL